MAGLGVTLALVAPLVLTPDRPEAAVGGHLEVLEDAAGTLTIDQVAAAGDERWVVQAEDNPTRGFTGKAYWGRLRLANPQPRPLDTLLVFRYALLDRVDLYLDRPDGGFDHHVAGDRLPYSRREIEHHRIVFEAPLAAGQTRTVWFRVASSSSVQLGLDVMTRNRFVTTASDELFARGIYYGVMLAIGIYNLFLFLSIRNRAYFWYVVYVFVFTATQMALDGTSGRYLFPEQPAFANTFTPLMVGSLLPLPFLFAQRFLDTRRHIPRWHRVLTVFVVVGVATIPLALLAPYALAMRVIAALVIPATIICQLVGILVLMKGYRPARFYVLAWSALIIGTLLYTLVMFGVIPATGFFVNVQRLGSACEVFLLSFALGDLITTMDRERETAKAEAVALDKDLALSAAVQGLLLPKKDAYESSALSLAGFYAPARRCGGDWWWYEPLPDGRVVVLLGDVTGHGAGAAMVTAAVAAAYRSAPDRLRRDDVRGLLEALNTSLLAICAGRHHMSFAAVEIDPSRLVARLWTAGAPAVLVLRKGGAIVPLASSGRPLGEPEPVIGAAEVKLERGDRIFVFSDGLPELSRSNGKQLGYRGVSRLLRGTSSRTPAEARQAIAATLRDDRSLEPQHDDITFVLVDLVDPVAKQQAA